MSHEALKRASEQPLLSPVKLGDLVLDNRVVMAPLTRSRANRADLTPTPLHAEYYAQRASAGLIISEGVWISPSAVGWSDVPGLYSPKQIRSWARVTDAVHAAGGLIFAQLWHTGALSHPDFFGGAAPLAPSAVNPLQLSVTNDGRKPTAAPQAMTRDDIRAVVRDYATAARNALTAGFDGVQLQAGWVYLIGQFLNAKTNLRSDEYGGSIENRARLLFEVLDAVAGAIDSRRIGVKTGPSYPETGLFTSNEGTLPTFDYVIGRLNDYALSHLLLMGAQADLSTTPVADLQGDGMFQHFRPLYRGKIVANVGFDHERGNRVIDDDLADLVAFGRPFIANPDLPARFAAGAALNAIDAATIYGGGSAGYTDYPFLDDAERQIRRQQRR